MTATERKAAAFAEWKADMDARHAEWAKLAAEHEKRIRAAQNAKYPASEGWVRIGPASFARLPGFDAPMNGEGI